MELAAAPVLPSLKGDILSESKAVKIAQLGKMNVMVGKADHYYWPRGSVGLSIAESRIPIKIFSARYNWVADPLYKEHSMLFLDTIRTHQQKVHREEVQYMIESDYITDPLNAYLFIGNLLLSGFKPGLDMTWASFFINEVGRALNKEETFEKLVD